MTRYQLKLVVLAGTAMLAVGASAFVTDWFVMSVGGQQVMLDLRSARACSPTCVSVPLSQFKGAYPTLGALAFWGSVPLLLVVGAQVGARLLVGLGYPVLARAGYAFGAIVMLSAFGAGYLFAPEAA